MAKIVFEEKSPRGYATSSPGKITVRRKVFKRICYFFSPPHPNCFQQFIPQLLRNYSRYLANIYSSNAVFRIIPFSFMTSCNNVVLIITANFKFSKPLDYSQLYIFHFVLLISILFPCIVNNLAFATILRLDQSPLL